MSDVLLRLRSSIVLDQFDVTIAQGGSEYGYRTAAGSVFGSISPDPPLFNGFVIDMFVRRLQVSGDNIWSFGVEGDQTADPASVFTRMLVETDTGEVEFLQADAFGGASYDADRDRTAWNWFDESVDWDSFVGSIRYVKMIV